MTSSPNDPKPTFNMGERGHNVGIIISAVDAIRSGHAAAGAVPPAWIKDMIERIEGMMQVISVNAAAVSSATALPVAPRGGKTSMQMDGKCCFEAAAGNALAVQAGASANEVGKHSAAKVDNAKQKIVENIIAINEEAVSFSVGDSANERERAAGEMWKQALATSQDDLLSRVLDNKEWGGYVELAAAMWGTDTEVVIVHAEGIHAKASDDTVQAGIYGALLAGLPAGPAKKRRIFVVLKQNHYEFGHVSQGNSKRVIFDIGTDADKALGLIVEHLKSENKGPLESLDGADRVAKIEKAIAERRKAEKAAERAAKGGGKATFADMVKRGRDMQPKSDRQSSRAPSKDNTPARSGGRSGPDSQTRQSARPKSASLCWQFKAEGKCKFGSECHFTHPNKETPPASKGNSRNEWQTVGNNRRDEKKRADRQPARSKANGQPVLRVHSKANMHPAKWKSKLRQAHPEVCELTSWVARVGNWFVLDAETGDVDELLGSITQLRKSGLTVERIGGDVVEEEEEEADMCANFLAGRKCQHESPCK